MQFGIGLPNLSYVDPTETLMRLAHAAQELAFDAIWVSDHVFMPYEYAPNYPYSTTGRVGLSATDPIFDPLTTLSFLAGQVPTPRLGISVLIMPYRNPIITAKMLVTLDVLSGGRVILGAGVGWMPEEFAALGASYEHRGGVTDEYIQIFRELCTADKPSFEGKHYHLARTLNSPQALSRPHPPILIGGQGERKTLLLVARYADACNLFDTPELAHKLDVLRGHCAAEGRDYATIEKTVQVRYDLGENGERVEQTIEHLHELAELGFTVAHGTLARAGTLRPLDLMAERVIPAIEKF